MPFIQTGYLAPEVTFNPFFRILSEIEKASNDNGNTNNACAARQNAARRHHGRKAQHCQSTRTYSPRFDVRETETSYELHGDLPGVDKENVSIEFTEPQTVVIRGHNERSYSNNNTNAAVPAVTEPKVTTAEEVQKDTASTHTHQASVSDEEDFEDLGEKSNTTKTDAAPAVEAPAATEDPAVEQPSAPEQPAEKYWFSERSIGTFERSFNFPLRVEQDGVTADLHNGVLHVSIPKAKKHEVRRVAVA